MVLARSLSISGVWGNEPRRSRWRAVNFVGSTRTDEAGEPGRCIRSAALPVRWSIGEICANLCPGWKPRAGLESGGKRFGEKEMCALWRATGAGRLSDNVLARLRLRPKES